jgi:phosphoglycolate phosphatase-like HAD superfamily hydrolase
MSTLHAQQSGARSWDEYDAYLFDIDGTLLHCTDAVHYFAFCEALSSLAGRPLNLDGVMAHGNTDVGILRDALTLASVPEEEWRPHLAMTREQLCQYVEARKSELSVAVLPGVHTVLNYLRARGAVLGVATGNLERIGCIKLGHCGLLPYFRFGGYSDQHEYRSDVLGAAVQQARRLVGKGASICVIGDTPLDVKAARANSLDIIAVATGIFSFEALQAEMPDLCVRSLLDLPQRER